MCFIDFSQIYVKIEDLFQAYCRKPSKIVISLQRLNLSAVPNASEGREVALKEYLR